MLALAEHACLRDELQPRPKEASFFVSLTRKRLSYAVVQDTFRQLINTAGIGTDAPSPPRLHDFRHTFAVRTLLSWYRSDEDVQAKIPSLSTYLGQTRPTHGCEQSVSMGVRPWPVSLGQEASAPPVTCGFSIREEWGGWGSNPRPRDYESPALTS